MSTLELLGTLAAAATWAYREIQGYRYRRAVGRLHVAAGRLGDAIERGAAELEAADRALLARTEAARGR